jgi:hypothetical protein
MMDKSYIAGFFDGEGSAIVITVRHMLSNGRATYTFRPIITIAQKTKPVLEQIRDVLGYGHLDKGHKGIGHKYIINSRGNIIRFVDDIGPYAFLKTKQLDLLKELSIYKGTYGQRGMYPRDVLIRIIDYRDAVHQLNKLTRDNITLKYSKDFILSEYSEDMVNEFNSKRYNHIAELGKKTGGYNKLPRKIIECACGCGKMLENVDNHGRTRRYITGHNNRGKNWVWRKNVS